MRWAHLNPIDILHKHGIEPHPGPYQHAKRDYRWICNNSIWTKAANDCNKDYDDEDVANIVTRNIRGLFSNLAAALRIRDHVECLQETDLNECSVPDLIAQAREAGYDLIFGDTVPLGKDAQGNCGKRVGILIKLDTPSTDITSKGDMYTDTLKAYGRWVERLVPLAGGQQMIVASLYGYSGASADT